VKPDPEKLADAVQRDPVQADGWSELRKLTTARVALGRSGASLPTGHWLQFKLDHAMARDAVHTAVDWQKLEREVTALGVRTVRVKTGITSREDYLSRPDLGRTLSDTSRCDLTAQRAERVDLVILLCDGLSALALQSHAVALLAALLPELVRDGWRVGPVVLAEQARVGLQDEVGAALDCAIALTLIGERPGLGSPDSLGAYFVHNPRSGNTDANRNCVSNIRPGGLPPAEAAQTLRYLLNQARQRQISGVALKDDRDRMTQIENVAVSPAKKIQSA
jgi:ethanolamine ammonia-lyase small subunit